MKNLALKVQRFLVSEDGPTAVEYAVMLALIIIVCLTAIQAIGTNANATFHSVAAKLPAGALVVWRRHYAAVVPGAPTYPLSAAASRAAEGGFLCIGVERNAPCTGVRKHVGSRTTLFRLDLVTRS